MLSIGLGSKGKRGLLSLFHGVCCTTKGTLYGCIVKKSLRSSLISTIQTFTVCEYLESTTVGSLPVALRERLPTKHARVESRSTCMHYTQLKQLANQLRTPCRSPVSKLKLTHHTLFANFVLAPPAPRPFALVKPHLQRRYIATIHNMAPQLDGYFNQ